MNRATSNFNFNKFLDSLKTKLNENEFYFQPLLNGDDESVWLESKTFIVGFFVNDIKKFNILIDLATKNNGKCLSTEYCNRNTKYLWECEKGHQWSATLQNISRTAWCPNCRDSIGERLISKILILMEIDFIKEYFSMIT